MDGFEARAPSSSARSGAGVGSADPFTQALHDPWLGPGTKGWPADAPGCRVSEVGARGWHALAGDLPLPIALLRRERLQHNLDWMARQAARWGIDLAPHGKTTMSPQLFARQLDAGAWGITFASVAQLAVGVGAAGVQRALIANQVVQAADLRGIRSLQAARPGLRVVFLVDSVAQLEAIEQWARDRPQPDAGTPFEVLLELGLAGGRTGCRTDDQALVLGGRLRASRAVRFVGLAAYEGLWAKGDDAADRMLVDGLMDRLEALALHAQQAGWFDGCEEVLVSAGGSAVYDLVATRLRPALAQPVRGLLRSGCYVTHDHGFYERLQRRVDARLGIASAQDRLRPALEVWAMVQSCPEPGLAILGVGKRDLSFDFAMPVPVARAAIGARMPQAAPAGWRIDALNDQHAYLRFDPGATSNAAAGASSGPDAPPVVGERIGLGISHPCTTFDKWRWMPLVEEDYRVSGALHTCF